MAKLVFGTFSDRQLADAAIKDLTKAGYTAKDISVVTRDVQEKTVHTTGDHVAAGTVSGAATGVAIGGLTGILLGIGAITIPGIGPLLIGGPLAAALGLSGAAATAVSGAVTGAVGGGLFGAFVGAGIPEETAKVYEQRVKEGATLLAIPLRNENQESVSSILHTHNADQIEVITTK